MKPNLLCKYVRTWTAETVQCTYVPVQIDRYLLIAIGFAPGGSVKVQYLQTSTHTLEEEEHRRVNNNEQHNKTEEYTDTENNTVTENVP